MAKLVVHQDKITDIQNVLKICPFGAMEENNGKLEINAGCKMCRLCVKKGPQGAFEYIEEEKKTVDKEKWRGIAVYADHVAGEIHPVTYELIGKAKELAKKVNQPVYVVFMGKNVSDSIEELRHYGVDAIYVYDSPVLEYFRIEPYAAAFEMFIKEVQPSVILVGATTVGRQLAPRIAARFRTGLTADCTVLDIEENTDLIQIRPAFGGNIMAQIATPHTRPQLATVRYKVMQAPERKQEKSGNVLYRNIDTAALCHVDVLSVVQKEKEKSIDGAEVLVVAGRGMKRKEDLDMLEEFADLLGGQVASTRPLVESGWLDAKKQVGLSGRTVRPKLIITCGVSGAIQFVAGMNHSDVIVAINNDPKASIFSVANYGLIGDMYQIIPELIGKMKARREVFACTTK